MKEFISETGRYFVEMPDGTQKESFRLCAFPIPTTNHGKVLPKYSSWFNMTLSPTGKGCNSYRIHYGISIHHGDMNFHGTLSFRKLMEVVKLRGSIRGIPSLSEEIRRDNIDMTDFQITMLCLWLMENGMDKFKELNGQVIS